MRRLKVKGGGPQMPAVRNCPNTVTGFSARSSDFRQFCSLGMGFTLLPQSGFCPGLSATVRNDRNDGLSTYRRVANNRPRQQDRQNDTGSSLMHVNVTPATLKYNHNMEICNIRAIYGWKEPIKIII